MAEETSLLSRHFSSHELAEQVSAKPWIKCFDFKCQNSWIQKESESLEKMMLRKDSLKHFQCYWSLRVKDFRKSRVLLKTTMKNCGTNLSIIFPPLSTQVHDWLRNPYSESSAQPENVTLRDEAELHELQSDCTLKIRFTNLSLDKFWISVKEEHPAIHREAIYILLQFFTSYMHEQAFSCLTSIKSKSSRFRRRRTLCALI
jgi:hypothetical protein